MLALQNDVMRRIFGKVEIETIIKKMQGRKLKQTEKNYLYRSIRPKLMAAAQVTDAGVLHEINKGKREDTAAIEYNLSLYGYRMITNKGKKSKRLGIEELMIKILAEKPHARYIEAIPILLIKSKVDPLKLLELASNRGVKNKLGYMIETAMLVRNLPHLAAVLRYLEKSKDKGIMMLSDGKRDFLMETSPARVKRWNLLGRFFDDDFKRNAEAYL